MNKTNLLLSQNENFKLVEVVFLEQPAVKTYTYKTTLDVAEDDLVVVHAPDGFKVVKVVRVLGLHEFQGNFQIKWLVSKVDLEYYESCKETESNVQKEMNRFEFEKTKKEFNDQLVERLGKDAVTSLKGIVKL